MNNLRNAPAAILMILTILLLIVGCGKLAELEAGPIEPVFEKGHRAKIIPEVEEPEIEEPEIVPELPTGILVVVDNYEAARPQSGIDKADVVYEVMVEGGITRYLALFYTEAAPAIGPVRSARYYFVQLAKGMDLPIAHVGGSDDSLTMIGSLRVKDINEMTNAQSYFWQDWSRSRPHNTYTSTENLVKAVTNKQYAYKIPDLPPVAEEFTGSPLTDRQVNVTYVPSYTVQWIWDETLGEGGQYRRHINYRAQSTADGSPMAADTIFIIAAASRDQDTEPVATTVDIVGGGGALCIVENKVIRGTWRKESAERPLMFIDAANAPMTRKQGKIWVQVVDRLEDVSFGR
ncbi:MAG: DUF3048 domain-containing protein [Peptococcaceae bacterium]|jgi:hypothetical protein|nr:DUF3048 domain-containing protein [Peptococcaceae bacterium]